MAPRQSAPPCGIAYAAEKLSSSGVAGGLGGTTGRLSCVVGQSIRAIEYSGAPRGDRETKLVEREGKRHSHCLVEFLMLALMDDCDYEIVRFDLKLFECRQALRYMRLADKIEHALQQPQPLCALVPAQVARQTRDGRSEYRKDQHAVEDIVAVSVEERLLTVVQIGQRAWMRDHVGILVGRGRRDFDLARHRGGKRLPRRIDKLRQRGDGGVAVRFSRHQIFSKAETLETVI